VPQAAATTGVADAAPRVRPKRRLPVWTHPLLYGTLRTITTVPQVVGVHPAAEAAGGLGLAFARAGFNRSRVKKAADRVQFAMPGTSPEAATSLVHRSYEHLFRLGVEIGYIPRLLSDDAWVEHVRLGPLEGSLEAILQGRPSLMLTGHCGNWEVLCTTMALMGFPMRALYRPLDMKPLDTWVRRTRARRGVVLLDKFGASRELPALVEAGVPIGVVADQNAGDKGLFVPFFGRLTSTYKTIGLLAIRHNANVVCSFARRLPATRQEGFQYCMEVTDVIRPEDWADAPDPLFYLTARYRRAIEKMVRTSPEQYLWMHRIWKSRPRHERLGRPVPDALREKLGALPWMDDDAVERVCEQSETDRRFLKENGLARMP
jgi:Kdo2-lipid IVA lauroyltransferase/acyltransferase